MICTFRLAGYSLVMFLKGSNDKRQAEHAIGAPKVRLSIEGMLWVVLISDVIAPQNDPLFFTAESLLASQPSSQLLAFAIASRRKIVSLLLREG